MDELDLKYALEAILFASGESVALQALARAIEKTPSETRELLRELMEDYDRDMRGLRIMQMENRYQMLTRNEYFPYIRNIVKATPASSLSQAALETLSIVAYRQPVTRADIEYIRGVQSSSSLDLLVDRGFVRIAGKLDAPGRPVTYETTPEFLKLMDITSISEMPKFEEFSGGIQLRLEEQPEENGQQ